jgi:glycosyltransferase involved in cell wall biosynthesis
VVVVNDNSTDKTAEIVLASPKKTFISLVEKKSSAIHFSEAKSFRLQKV